MKSVMLTGATGFIGSHIAERLILNGIETHLFIRSRNLVTESLKKKGATLHVEKPDDHATLSACIEKADIVIHCAGATKGLREEDYFRSNVELTTRILNQMQSPQKMIFISSQAVAGPSNTRGPLDETAQPDPLTYYGKSKHLAEKQVREWGMSNHDNYTILRPCVVYGPREKDIYNYFKLMKKGVFLVLGNGDKRFSIIHVEDIVRAVLLCMDHPGEGETYFVCSDDAPSWEELGTFIQKALKKNRILRIRIPETIASMAAIFFDATSCLTRKPPLVNRQKIIEARQSAWLCSNKKIKEKMNWRPEVPLKAGIQQTTEWYIRNNWI